MEMPAGQPRYQDLLKELEEKRIVLEVDAGRAISWLVGQSTERKFRLEKGMAINYIQWLILLPGVASFFLVPLPAALVLLAACIVLFRLIHWTKSQLMLAGVKEFIAQDLDTLNQLYQNRVVRFRRRLPRKEPPVQHPRNWWEVLEPAPDTDAAAGNPWDDGE